MTILLNYDQFCHVNPSIPVLYTNDDTLIIYDSFVFEISSVCMLVPPPQVIATYTQSIITALNHKVQHFMFSSVLARFQYNFIDNYMYVQLLIAILGI